MSSVSKTCFPFFTQHRTRSTTSVTEYAKKDLHDRRFIALLDETRYVGALRGLLYALYGEVFRLLLYGFPDEDTLYDSCQL